MTDDDEPVVSIRCGSTFLLILVLSIRGNRYNSMGTYSMRQANTNKAGNCQEEGASHRPSSFLASEMDGRRSFDDGEDEEAVHVRHCHCTAATCFSAALAIRSC
eukprot:2888740-Pleurochrysis_carterae.AAC.1